MLFSSNHYLLGCHEKLLCGFVVYLPLLSWAADDRVDIARFSQGNLSGWQPEVLAYERIRAGFVAIDSDVENDNVSTQSNLPNFHKEFP